MDKTKKVIAGLALGLSVAGMAVVIQIQDGMRVFTLCDSEGVCRAMSNKKFAEYRKKFTNEWKSGKPLTYEQWITIDDTVKEAKRQDKSNKPLEIYEDLSGANVKNSIIKKLNQE